MSRSTNAESGWLVYPQLLWPVGAERSFGFWTKKAGPNVDFAKIIGFGMVPHFA